MAPVYETLSRICNEINDRMFVPVKMDVGNICLLIYRKKGYNGYCYKDENWKVNGDGAREIALTDGAILGGINEIMTTLAHELIHAYHGVANVKGCSGKYHNKKFASACDKIGLQYKIVPKHGVITPSQEHPIFTSILSSLTDSERDIINNVSVLIDLGSPSKSKTKNLVVHICPVCGAKARATETTHLLCGDCSEPEKLVSMEVSEE